MIRHRVEPGDTFGSLAQKYYGTFRHWEAVAYATGNVLSTGAWISLPETPTIPTQMSTSTAHTVAVYSDPGQPVRLKKGAEEIFEIPSTVLRYYTPHCEYCGCRGTIENGYCSRCGGPEDVIVIE